MRRGRQEFLTPDELLSVVRAAKAHSVRTWAMTVLSYKLALRASECCHIRMEDISGSTIFVRRVKNSISYRHELTKVKGCPLLNAPRVLKEWLAVRNMEEQLRGSNSPFLFPTEKAEHIDPKSWHRIFSGVAKDVGLPPGKTMTHILRHSRASHLALNHADMLEIAAALGHASITSTAIYCHVGATAADAAAKRVDAILF